MKVEYSNRALADLRKLSAGSPAAAPPATRSRALGVSVQQSLECVSLVPRLRDGRRWPGVRRKVCEDRRGLGWSTQPSCGAERPERRLDFRFGRHAAAIGIVDRRQLILSGVIHAGPARFDLASSFFQLDNVLLRPGGNPFEQLFGAWAHSGNISHRRGLPRPARSVARAPKGAFVL